MENLLQNKDKLVIKKNYNEMSQAAAEAIFHVLAENPFAVVVLATGHSPLEAYRKLVLMVKDRKLDISNVTWIKLDEWMGVSGDDKSSCEFFIQKEIIEPLHVNEDHYIHFDNNAADMEAEAERIEAVYRGLQRIDLVILGIGMNGHLGLNEPDIELKAYAHTAGLDVKTKTHELLKHTTKKVEGGITLGMKDLFKGEQILLLADGKDKEKGLEYYLNDLITTEVPVSLLKLHGNCTCIVNAESFHDMFLP